MTRKASAIALAAALLSSGALAQEQDQRASFGDDASYNYLYMFIIKLMCSSTE